MCTASSLQNHRPTEGLKISPFRLSGGYGSDLQGSRRAPRGQLRPINTEPACLILSSQSNGFPTQSSRCSGAISFAISTAASRVSATMIFPLLSMEVLAMSALSSSGICTSSSFCTASASSTESSQARRSPFCHAQPARAGLPAAWRGSVPLSATISISLGPAIMSIET